MNQTHKITTRTLAYGLLTWLLYLAGRTWLQHVLPYQDPWGFLAQDAWITLLRLTCCLVVLWLYWTSMGPQALLGAQEKRGLVWIAVALAIWYVGGDAWFLRGIGMAVADWRIRAVEVGIAFIVAANEEIAYRGLFLDGFSQRFGPNIGAWLSSFLFMAMHFGYAPLHNLLYTFMIGMAFARYRQLGTSLLVLVGVHAAIDIFDAIYMPMGAPQESLPYVVKGLMLAAAWTAMEWRRTE